MPAVNPKSEETINNAVILAAGLGVPGIFNPVVDTVGITAIWSVMTLELAALSGHPIDTPAAGKLASAAVAGVTGYQLGSKILTWAASPLIAAFPYAGIPAAVALNAGLNGLFTYRLGVEVAQAFNQPGFSRDQLMQLSLSIAGRLIRLPKAKEIRYVAVVLRPRGGYGM